MTQSPSFLRYSEFYILFKENLYTGRNSSRFAVPTVFHGVIEHQFSVFDIYERNI